MLAELRLSLCLGLRRPARWVLEPPAYRVQRFLTNLVQVGDDADVVPKPLLPEILDHHGEQLVNKSMGCLAHAVEIERDRARFGCLYLWPFIKN